jgi:hypothetical protein
VQACKLKCDEVAQDLQADFAALFRMELSAKDVVNGDG